MEDNIEVRCCNCDWQGTEYELELIGIVEIGLKEALKLIDNGDKNKV